MNLRSEKLRALLKLSHDLASPFHPLAILGEGNTSARLDRKTFLVKASGSSLGTLAKSDVVECRADVLLALLDDRKISDVLVDPEIDGRPAWMQLPGSLRWRHCFMPGF